MSSTVKSPSKDPPLVYDDGHLDLLLLKVLQNLVDAPVLGDRQDLAGEVFSTQDRLQAAVSLDGAQDVFDMHRPDNPVDGVVFEDWVTSVNSQRRHRDELLQFHPRRERHDVRSWNHDLPRPGLFELDD
jgi:hypothetical protein